MSIEEGIITRTAAIAGGRCYPLLAPLEATLPLLIYSTVGAPQLYNMAGDVTPRRSRVRIVAWAQTYSEAHSIIDEVKTALTTDGADLVAYQVEADHSLFDPEERAHGIARDFYIHEVAAA